MGMNPLDLGCSPQLYHSDDGESGQNQEVNPSPMEKQWEAMDLHDDALEGFKRGLGESNGSSPDLAPKSHC